MLESKHPQKTPETLLKSLKVYLSPVRFRIYFEYGLIFLGNLIGASVVIAYGAITAAIISPNEATDLIPWIYYTPLTEAVLAAIGIYIFAEICYRTAHFMEAGMAVDLRNHITNFIYQRLLNRSTIYHEDRLSGEVATRVSQSASSVVYLVDQLPWFLGWMVSTNIVAAYLFTTSHVHLGIVYFAWLGYFLLTSAPLLYFQAKVTKLETDSTSTHEGNVIDSITNISLVQSFAAHTQEFKRFSSIFHTALKYERKGRYLKVINKLHQGTSIILLIGGIVWMTVHLAQQDLLNTAQIVSVLAILPALGPTVWFLGDTIENTLGQLAILRSASLGLKLPDTLVQNNGTKTLKSQTPPDMKFQNIVFHYNANHPPALSIPSLHIETGEKVGIVGASGAGKSTLAKLMLRNIDPSKGSIEIGGENIKEYTLESLRNYIALVPQDTTLFYRTIKENILYARPGATCDDLINACKQASIHDFIQSLPKGYETLVGERGTKLSGGQRQRVALARAILKNAPILLLDEATSALDTESETVIQSGLKRLIKDRTVIAIAHRLSTLSDMTRILVIDNGKIVEDGHPKTLLKNKQSEFAKLWQKQKDGFIG